MNERVAKLIRKSAAKFAMRLYPPLPPGSSSAACAQQRNRAIYEACRARARLIKDYHATTRKTRRGFLARLRNSIAPTAAMAAHEKSPRPGSARS